MSARPAIAIVGIGGVFPGAPDLDTFWSNIVERRSAAREVPAGRWLIPAEKAYHSAAATADRVHSRRGCFIESLPPLDGDGIEVDSELLDRLDPLFRLLLVATQRAVADAKLGAGPRRNAGLVIGNIALPTESSSALSRYVLGRSFEESLFASARAAGLPVRGESAYPAPSAHPLNRYVTALPAGIAAKAFGLGLGSYTLDAACASSLYAVKLACEELIAGRADVMLTGGVSRPDSLYTQMGFSQLRAVSPTGICSPFDRKADGLVVGEGAGILVLKRLADALRDGDHVYGVIGGIGLSNDVGGGLLAPSSEGQLRAMRAAYAEAEWDASTIDLFECHATGTQLGDAVEFSSLKTLAGESAARSRKAVIGSVKSNIGHLLTGAGSAALIKTLLALRNQALPPTANFERAAADIDLETSPFEVLTEARRWTSDHRRAAVSAFGFGGINAHLLVEEFEQSRASEHQPVVLSTASPVSIVGLAAHIGPWENPQDLSAVLLGSGGDPEPHAASGWSRSQASTGGGYFIDQVSLAMSDYRIPPREVEEMLPQQILMLDVAAQALKDSGLDISSLRGGVFIGANLDLNTTNFSFRWDLENAARSWAKALGVNTTGDQLESWVETLRSEALPPLTANRTMGALASVIASRIARELRIGGPSFTLSAEENSGTRALEVAVRALQRREIDFAIVGAVDLAGDVRAMACAQASGASANLFADGAVAFVLQRADDAAPAYADVVDVRVMSKPEGHQEQQMLSAERVGHCGAAASLVELLRAVLAIRNEVEPVGEPKHWLRNRRDGLRETAVVTTSVDSNLGTVTLREPSSRKRVTITMPQTEALFLLAADSPQELLATITALESSLTHDDIVSAAADWWTNRASRRGSCRLSVITRSVAQLREQIAFARHSLLSGSPQSIEAFGKERLFFSTESFEGKIAFVYPGSGNAFRGMGRELALSFPGVLDAQDAESTTLLDQYRPDLFWDTQSSDPISVREAIFGQVAYSTLATDVLKLFGIHPAAAIGYSLGETSALFSLRAWRDRDEMLERMQQSSLFGDDLTGECRAARRAWQLGSDESSDWVAGVVDRPADVVRKALDRFDRAYLLVINTPYECVIGGERSQIENVVRQLGAQFIALDSITTVHCPVVDAVADEYRDFHLRETHPVPDVAFYSGARGAVYEVTRESAAEAILGHARSTLDFSALIQRAWEDGIRLFVEVGPGASCTRMIGRILADRPHAARSLSNGNASEIGALLRLLGFIAARAIEIDLSPLYSDIAQPSPMASPRISVATKPKPFEVKALPPQTTPRDVPGVGQASSLSPLSERAMTSGMSAKRVTGETPVPHHPLLHQTESADAARVEAHAAYLRFTEQMTSTIGSLVSMQLRAVASAPAIDIRPVPLTVAPPHPPALRRPCVFDREQCMEIAIGSIANVLGPEFAEVDTFPTRVRLPDEPLMLVDRIVELEGEPRSLTSGRVVTEHDVLAGGWYLDCERMVTSTTIEAGQADLFLSGYLGIDFKTRGLAMYRLLDAAVTFYRGLPRPGDVIRYDIRIERFFRQGETYLFRFEFEASLDGEPLASMKNGCAGFFTAAELSAGQGIVKTKLDLMPAKGKRPGDWRELVPMRREAYSDAQIEALRGGDLVAAFGGEFAGVALKNPVTLPGGRLELVHRVVDLDPSGGRFGLGVIRGEADIHPDNWFLTCHFSDDQVMPGTLMYECCLHTLRIFLLRMGWIAEEGSVAYEPVPGVASQLKCRGQVIASTKKVTYEIEIKELGYRPEPYAIADALMYADGKPIVEITNMSIQMTGVTRDQVEELWCGTGFQPVPLPDEAASLNVQHVGQEEGQVGNLSHTGVFFTREQLFEFSSGLPSKAFGERYKVFDRDRVIARLPAAPFAFIDQVNWTTAEAAVMVAGGEAEAEYTIPPGAWYFDSNRQTEMPFAVLLEIALQPCGWLSAFMGAALTSETDLSYRNLGGRAVLHRAVTRDSGTLTTRVKVTNVSATGGMIIHNFDFEIRDRLGVVYVGDTTFGFFSRQALANQVGIRDVARYERTGSASFVIPDRAPFPDSTWRMADRVDQFDAAGGPNHLGYLRGSKRVDPAAWFFKAHFVQDPVWPGSLGLESLLQLLRGVAVERWKTGDDAQFSTISPGREHSWIYRGQILPTNEEVVVEAVITSVDDGRREIVADGLLLVDGKPIYQMNGFGLELGPES